MLKGRNLTDFKSKAFNLYKEQRPGRREATIFLVVTAITGIVCVASFGYALSRKR